MCVLVTRVPCAERVAPSLAVRVGDRLLTSVLVCGAWQALLVAAAVAVRRSSSAGARITTSTKPRVLHNAVNFESDV